MQNTVIWSGKAKSHLQHLPLLPPFCCHWGQPGNRSNKRDCQNMRKKSTGKKVHSQAACGSKGVIKQVGLHLLTLQLCSRMRLLLTGDFLKTPLSALRGDKSGLYQAQLGHLNNQTDQHQTKDKMYSWGNELRAETILAFLTKSLLLTIVQEQKEEKSLMNTKGSNLWWGLSNHFQILYILKASCLSKVFMSNFSAPCNRLCKSLKIC